MSGRRAHDAAPDELETPQEQAYLLRRATQTTCGLGVAFALLFIISLLAFAQAPRIHASDADVVSYYSSEQQRMTELGGLYLLPLAAVAFLWFTASLRGWTERSSRTIDHVMSTVQMLSGVGFITLTLAAAGAATVVSLSSSASGTPIDPSLARQFPLYGQTLLIVFGMRMAAIFVMSTSKMAHGGPLFPHWFTLGSVGVALVLFLTASLNPWLAAVFPLWVLVLCALIWQRSRLHIGAATATS